MSKEDKKQWRADKKSNEQWAHLKILVRTFQRNLAKIRSEWYAEYADEELDEQDLQAKSHMLSILCRCKKANTSR